MQNKNFKIRNTREEDYKTICDWWDWWPIWEPQPRWMLPDNLSDGIMVTYKGEDLCAGFIYRTSASKLFKCEYIVSSYKIKNREVRKEGLELLIDGLKYMSVQMGAKVIYTSLNNDALMVKYRNAGFVQGSKGCTEMLYLADSE